MYFALTFYCVGIGLYSTIVTLHAWNLVGNYQASEPLGQLQETANFYEQFQVVREYQSTFTISMFVFPLAFRTILNVILFWCRPRGVPKWTVW